MEKVKVDLACGLNKREGYLGVDIADVPGVDIVHDLNVYPWPFEDESVDEINVSHYVEHIKHDDVLGDIKTLIKDCSSFDEFKTKVSELPAQQDGFIKFINEVYRILKPEGKVHIVSPYYTSMRAYGDPTHVRFIGDSTLWYLDKEWRDTNHLEHYGINCDFNVKLTYYITSDMTLKSEEVRNKAFAHDWNAIEDIIIDLTKK